MGQFISNFRGNSDNLPLIEAPILETDSFEDRAHGCIIGAFIGDSCGSYNEFASVIQND